MKTRFIFLFAAMALLAGCAKEEKAPMANENKEGVTVLQVGLPSNPTVSSSIDSKTHMGEAATQGKHKVYWSNGDKIRVNGEESVALSGLADDASSATFTINSVLDVPYKVLYPSSIYGSSIYYVNLPAVQEYKAGSFAEGALPMAGYSADGTNITMHHLCAIYKVQILRASTDPDEHDIVAVRFRGRNSEQVSGTFEISYDGHSLGASNGSGGDLEVKVVGRQATSTTTPAVYYIVVPARAYQQGFDVIIQDVQGHIMTKSLEGYQFPEAGHLYPLKAFEFAPTGTEVGIEINSAADLVKFAQDFNAGVYAGQEDLVASLGQNITFDAESSAAFNATGGIGTKSGEFETTVDNYFFGTFNGANHTISGLAASVPLFAYTDTVGVIENLTLDSSCSLKVDAPAIRGVHATIVGRHKGILSNCISYADVTINNLAEVSTTEQHYGGIAGRNYGGIIEGCHFYGDIVCSQSSVTISANKANFGGIAGTQADKGSISNSSFTGNITVSDGTTYGGIDAPKIYFYAGGIVGYATDGIIDGCTAGVSGTPSSIDIRGILVPAVGGIAGWLSADEDSGIRYCANYMNLSASSNGARANTTPCRVGGIASHSAAVITESDNYGAISSLTNSTTLYLGGIVADGVGPVKCINYSSGTITRTNAEVADLTQTNRYMYIGGIVGAISAASQITDCTNKAAVTSNILGTATNSTLDLGGILGGGATFKAEISGCTNEGEIKLDNDNASAVAVARTALGGIFGYASTAGSSVSDSDNSGKVWCNNNAGGSYGTISIGGTIGRAGAAAVVTDCTNSGEILCQNPGAAISAYVDLGGIVGFAENTIDISGTAADKTANSGTVTVAQASSAILYARNTQGGILGYGQGNNTKISNCKNSQQIYCNLTGVVANNRSSYTGGIAGLLAKMTYSSNAASGLGALIGVEVANCNSTGKVNVSNYCNRAGNKNSPFGGGLIGLVSGTSESKASIHDCTVGSQTVYGYRGTIGGAIGYANLCTLENINCAADMSGSNANVNGVGGIVARLFDGSMTSCTFSGKIAKAKNIGGLVYTMSEQTTGSTISACKVNGATLTSSTTSGDGITAAAVLVSITDEKTNTITGCGVKGTLDGAAITLDSKMITTKGGATTVTGTYLL